MGSEQTSGRSGRLCSHRCIRRVQKMRPWVLTHALYRLEVVGRSGSQKGSDALMKSSGLT